MNIDSADLAYRIRREIKTNDSFDPWTERGSGMRDGYVDALEWVLKQIGEEPIAP